MVTKPVFGAVLAIWLCSACAAQQNLIDGPVSAVKARLGTALGCSWQGNETTSACSVEPLHGLITIATDAKGSLDSIEIDALNDVSSKKEQQRENESRKLVLDVIHQLFPSWNQANDWLTKTLLTIKNESEDKVHKTVVDGWQVSVNALHPADLDDGYAEIMISRPTQNR
jgi:hypothetical protein